MATECFADGTYYSPLQDEIVKLLEENGPMTRADLVNQINRPRTTIYDNLMGLMIHHVVEKFARPTNSRGRPLVFFRMVEAGS